MLVEINDTARLMHEGWTLEEYIFLKEGEKVESDKVLLMAAKVAAHQKFEILELQQRVAMVEFQLENLAEALAKVSEGQKYEYIDQEPASILRPMR